jgi:hypothetical protein
MTAAASIGLMSIFVVDLLSLLYVSRLGDPNLTAAVGYATQVLFFSVSINIGLSIAIGALGVARDRRWRSPRRAPSRGVRPRSRFYDLRARQLRRVALPARDSAASRRLW